MAQKRIVIIGGGFGGVHTARTLEKLLRPEEAEICLVNRENYFVFQPLLPEVLTGSLGVLDTVAPIRRLCPRTRLYTREVERIDLAGRQVVMLPGFRPRASHLPYDVLVLAPGAVVDFTGMQGMAEHALPFRTLGDALRLRNRLIQAMEEAENETDLEFRRRLLTFVVAGGGFSGVKVVAEINDFVRGAVRHFRNIRQEDIRSVLVHSGELILPEMSPSLARHAQNVLAKRGIELRLRSRIESATADSAVISGAEVIGTRTVVSTVPAGPAPLIEQLDVPKEKGRLNVTEFLEVRGHEGVVWAVGDCTNAGTPTGRAAESESQAAAGNICAVLRGQTQKSFHFEGYGKLGSLGHHSGVAEVMGLRISGFLAWILWRLFYLGKMPGLDQKFRVAFDSFTSLLFPTDFVQVRIQASDNITYEHFAPGEVVFEEGDVGDRLYVIRKGQVEVLQNGSQVSVLGTGEYFGEMALLSSRPRTATVRALQATDLLAVNKGDFDKLLIGFPEFQSGLSELAARRSA
ncbi:MAG TPA: FAD-dependent oxidoreductase [Candidatus Angelobacter sp.]|nr:FAD-dependent oxidoreductase [Candidatus Angelobacter sp.]